MDLTSIDTHQMQNSIEICNKLMEESKKSKSVIELEYVIHKNKWTYEKILRLCKSLMHQ